MRSLPPDHRYWSATTGARLRLPPRRFRLPPEPGVSTPSPGVTLLLQRQLRRDLGDLANHRGTVRRESAGLHPNSDRDPFWRPRRHRPVPSASMSDPHKLVRCRPSQPSFGVGVPTGRPRRRWLRHLRCGRSNPASSGKSLSRLLGQLLCGGTTMTTGLSQRTDITYARSPAHWERLRDRDGHEFALLTPGFRGAEPAALPPMLDRKQRSVGAVANAPHQARGSAHPRLPP